MKSKRYLYISILNLSLLLCFLTGCSKSLSSKNSLYIYTYGDKNQTTINLLDEDGKETFTEKIATKGDVSYNVFKNNTLYLYGPGGLLKFSLADNSLEKIVNGGISFVQETTRGLFYIGNGNLVSENGYSSGLYLNDNLLFTVDYPINSAYFKDNIIHLSNIPYDENKEVFITTYDMKGNLLDKQSVESLGIFQEIQGNISFVSKIGYKNLDTNSDFVFPLVQNSLYNPLVYSNALKTVDYRGGNTCEILNQTQGNIEAKIDCNHITSAQNGYFALRYKDKYTIINLNDNTQKELLLEQKDRSLENLFVIDK